MPSRGIGVHHGGLLPMGQRDVTILALYWAILTKHSRWVVEILFARGLIIFLPARETFAMVRRTCLLGMFFFMYLSTKLRREHKHDGHSFRDINERDKVYPYSHEKFNTEALRDFPRLVRLARKACIVDLFHLGE